MNRAHFTDRSGMNRTYRARAIFAPYYKFINELQSGEVSCIEDSPVIEWNGECELAAPILHGWAAVWERIQAKRPCGINVAPLQVIADRLDRNEGVTPDEAYQARVSLDACLKAYKRLPLQLIAECARAEEIAIKMQSVAEKARAERAA